jgi:hypothetical protein
LSTATICAARGDGGRGWGQGGDLTLKVDCQFFVGRGRGRRNAFRQLFAGGMKREMRTRGTHLLQALLPDVERVPLNHDRAVVILRVEPHHPPLSRTRKSNRTYMFALSSLFLSAAPTDTPHRRARGRSHRPSSVCYNPSEGYTTRANYLHTSGRTQAAPTHRRDGVENSETNGNEGARHKVDKGKSRDRESLVSFLKTFFFSKWRRPLFHFTVARVSLLPPLARCRRDEACASATRCPTRMPT